MRRDYTETELLAQLVVANDGCVACEPAEIAEFATERCLEYDVSP